MQLKSARVEGFRGIRDVTVEFDDLTVLIGESDSGKSSLLNALDACLGREAPPGGFRFAINDLHLPFSPGRPMKGLKIELEFDGEAPTRLLVEADPPELAPRWRIVRPDGSETSDPADLDHLRRMVPLVRVRSGLVQPPPRVAAEEPDELLREGIEAEVTRTWRELVSGAGVVPEAVAYRAMGALAQLVEEKQGWPLDLGGAAIEYRRVAAFLRSAGSRGLALLAFTGAFLEARGPEALAPEASPIVILENPEAHLHPTVLQAVWRHVHGFRAQKVLTTNSPELLSAAPLEALRRMVRTPRGELNVFRLHEGRLNPSEYRRVSYHVRARRGGLFFMRFWLLVEGETEYWMMPHVAQAVGYDLLADGIDCVEFAQCGVEPLVKLADSFGIGWHLLADGDGAGQRYAGLARGLMSTCRDGAITLLPERDMEHLFWSQGYEPVFRKAAGMAPARHPTRPDRIDAVVEQALRRSSKPAVALAIAEAMNDPESPGVPEVLREVILDAVRRARG